MAERTSVLTEDIAPLQAERLFSNTTLEHFGAYVLDLRSRVEAGFPEAKNELQLVIERLGPWYHNLTFAGTSTLSATPDYPASRWRMLDLDGAPPPFLTINYRWKKSTLRLFSALTTFGTALDIALQELRIESFFPADEATRVVLTS